MRKPRVIAGIALPFLLQFGVVSLQPVNYASLLFTKFLGWYAVLFSGGLDFAFFGPLVAVKSFQLLARHGDQMHELPGAPKLGQIVLVNGLVTLASQPAACPVLAHRRGKRLIKIGVTAGKHPLMAQF